MDYLKRAREVLDIETRGLQSVRDALDENFASAVDRILRCLDEKGKVIMTGVGKSLHIAEKLSATLASTGTTSIVLNPTQAMHGDLGMLNSEDLLIVLSYSGETDELISLIPAVKRLGVGIIALTGVADSTLAQCSDVVVLAQVDQEACPFNMAPTASTTAALAVGDALAMVLLEARGFEQKDYASLHPAGAIGRALLVRISDIMRYDNRLASVRSGASVREALLAMTEARSGSTGIVDPDGKLLGIFTDGDLRRHISDDPEILEKQVDTVMTPSPCTILDGSLAIAALKIFEERNIDDLLVVDKDGVLVGAIDIQDLPKMKII
jgi:arabinose-5-phosphate isomerase